jgi:hypothetical protein
MNLQLFGSQVSRLFVLHPLGHPLACHLLIAMNELMLRLLDTHVLLTSILDPWVPFPPNVRKIALSSDLLKHKTTDGIYTAEDAELAIQAAAELALSTEMYNQSGSTYEEDYGYKDEDDDHDVVQHQDDHDKNDHLKPQSKPKLDFW